ncbi:MAG TPA: succinylglutamate desuccinylase/aspartoacylase family protein, partial [Calditrichia bacterium]|nr:succinylglutamate desuccinylase/aspartoacylase family protein [Calditrichia bacterium]
MASESLATGVSARRILGDVTGSHEGPTVIFLAGVHGNEPAALEILEEIFPELENRRPQLRGRVVAICGNLGALSMGVRFIDEDLNRMWTPERVEAMLSTDHDAADASHEQQEQRAIFDALRPYLHTESGPVYLIDLHTTSAVSPPFIVMGDTLRNRKFAQHFHTPIILGLEERLSGTLLHYGGHIGLICMAFEAGQHQSAVARSNHRAAVWTTLVAAGSFSEDQVREFEPAQAILRKAGEGIPQLFEFTYHHLIAKNETFAMEPGFINFEAVNKGALLARNQDGPIRSPFDGYMFMPL